MAIAIDATASGNINSGTELTYAHTCTGSNLYLVVYIWSGSTVSGITYNAVSMTSLGSGTAVNGRTPYMFGLANPSTGANNVVATQAGSALLYSASASYTGCNSSQPEGAFETNTVVNSATITDSVSVTASNCWLVFGVNSGTNDNLGSGSDTGAQTTLRKVTPSNGTLYDSNGTVGTGSQAMAITMTASATDDMSSLLFALEPAATTTTSTTTSTSTTSTSSSTSTTSTSSSTSTSTTSTSSSTTTSTTTSTSTSTTSTSSSTSTTSTSSSTTTSSSTSTTQTVPYMYKTDDGGQTTDLIIKVDSGTRR